MSQDASQLTNSEAELVLDLMGEYLDAELPSIQHRLEARTALELLGAYSKVAAIAGNVKAGRWAREWQKELRSRIGAERSAPGADGASSALPNGSASALPPSATGSRRSTNRVAQPSSQS